MLAGPTSGAVFTFSDDGLSVNNVKNQLQFNRLTFIQRLGVNPTRLSGNLNIVEVNTFQSNISLYKPTPKDSNFNDYFRYNTSQENYGKTLDINTGGAGFKEYVMKEFNLPNQNILITPAN